MPLNYIKIFQEGERDRSIERRVLRAIEKGREIGVMERRRRRKGIDLFILLFFSYM
jgi:hypothetical protein